MNYVSHLWKSKTHAWKGIQYAFSAEANFRVQLIIAAIVIAVSGYFRVTRYELIIILSLIFAVLLLELLNTIIEFLLDIVKPRLHEQVKLIKDIAAGMVLLMSIAAILIGSIIFYPYFFSG